MMMMMRATAPPCGYIDFGSFCLTVKVGEIHLDWPDVL